jgi:hypothetical protein
MSAEDDRWLMGLMAAVNVARWLILAGTILVGIHLLRPLVELVAGRETAVDVSMQVSISFAVSISLGVATGVLVRDNRRLRRRVRELEAKRVKAKGGGARSKR